MSVEQVRAILMQILGQTVANIVIETPEGIALLSNDGRHILIRVDNARLEVAR